MGLPKWPNGAVCNTVVRRFKSGTPLQFFSSQRCWKSVTLRSQRSQDRSWLAVPQMQAYAARRKSGRTSLRSAPKGVRCTCFTNHAHVATTQESAVPTIGFAETCIAATGKYPACVKPYCNPKRLFALPGRQPGNFQCACGGMVYTLELETAVAI